MRASKWLWLGMLAVPSLGVAQQGALSSLPSGPKAYSMVLTTTEVKTLQDGSTITHVSVSRVFHDSQGRQRNEHDEQRGAISVTSEHGDQYLQPTAKVTSISIMDPNRSYTMNWSVGPNLARLVRHSSPNPAPKTEASPRQAFAADAPKAEQHREYLGRKTIMGLEADGSRLTTGYPANFDGNSMPYTTTADTWIARMGGGQAYQVIESSVEEPGTQTSTVLTSFTPGEPDPKLFEAPEGYTVWDPTKPVSEPAHP